MYHAKQWLTPAESVTILEAIHCDSSSSVLNGGRAKDVHNAIRSMIADGALPGLAAPGRVHDVACQKQVDGFSCGFFAGSAFPCAFGQTDYTGALMRPFCPQEIHRELTSLSKYLHDRAPDRMPPDMAKTKPVEEARSHDKDSETSLQDLEAEMDRLKIDLDDKIELTRIERRA